MRRKAVKGADQATTSGSELISEKPDRFHNIAEPAAFYGTFDKRDDVTLEFALAKFISNDDIAFGTEYVTDVTDKIDKKYRKRRNLHQYVAYPSGYLAFVFFGATAQKIFGHSDEANWDITSVVFVLLFLVCLASLMLWSHYQYDFNDRLNKPISLPDDADPRFDEFLFYLQQKQRNGRSIAYSYSRFRRGRVFVPRRLFFGRLRYLLFSDHLDTRSFVTRYLTGLPAPSEIFIHKDDLDWIIFDGKQKQNRHQAIIKSEPEQKGSGGAPCLLAMLT